MPTDRRAQDSRTWRTGRAAAGALGLLVAIVYLIEGRGLRMGTMDAPGPGIFPLVVGVIFALVSAGVIADALLTREPGAASFPKGADLRRLLLVAGGFLAYVLLLEVVGFLIATAAFVVFYTRIVGRTSWLASIASGILLTLVVWLVFDLVLGVRLPEAMWS